LLFRFTILHVVTRPSKVGKPGEEFESQRGEGSQPGRHESRD